MSARSIWAGTLSIGLVNVPVKAYKATDEKEDALKMRLLHRGCSKTVNQTMHCSTCNKSVDWADIVKGVAQEDGTFVPLTKEELDTIRPEKSDAIVVERFVPKEQVVDSLWIETTYYLVPDGKAALSGFATMLAAMEKTGRAAQGMLTIYGREHVVSILPSGSILKLQLMRTKALVRDSSELPNYVAPNAIKVDATQLKLAEQLVASLADDFDPTDYEDSYVEDFEKLVAAKKAGTAAPSKAAKTAPAASGDLMSALKASLDTKLPKVAKKALKVEPKGKSTRKKSA